MKRDIQKGIEVVGLRVFCAVYSYILFRFDRVAVEVATVF